MRVLIVEDEDDLRFLLSTALEVFGHEVIGAATGEEAVLLLDAEVDLVLLDVRLPGLDGFEVLSAMGAEAVGRTVMMSAHGDTAMARRADDAGCVAYLSKPFQLDELKRVIETLPPRARR